MKCLGIVVSSQARVLHRLVLRGLRNVLPSEAEVMLSGVLSCYAKVKRGAVSQREAG